MSYDDKIRGAPGKGGYEDKISRPQGCCQPTTGPNPGPSGEPWEGYYYSAYGIAVKHGFIGTEEEWLASLHGRDGRDGRDMGNPFVYRQQSAADTWEIHHELGRYPSVTVVDSGNTQVIGNVDYIDANTLTVSFVAPFSGSAYLN